MSEVTDKPAPQKKRWMTVVWLVLLVAFIAGVAYYYYVQSHVSEGNASKGDTVQVFYNARTVTARVGQEIDINMGQVSASVGIAWYVVTQPDEAVAGPISEQKVDANPAGVVGGNQILHYILPTNAVGETSMTYRACYRSGLNDCQPVPSGYPVEAVTMKIVVREK